MGVQINKYMVYDKCVYEVSNDSIDVGTYYPNEGLVLSSSEGSPIPLNILKTIINKLEQIENNGKPN